MLIGLQWVLAKSIKCIAKIKELGYHLSLSHVLPRTVQLRQNTIYRQSRWVFRMQIAKLAVDLMLSASIHFDKKNS